jgi:G3E family GTPase
VTGFLGSGKTTLLNALLRARPASSHRWALLVNEFGDVGVDRDLLPADQTRQVELSGGCICCQLDEDLEKTLCEVVDGAPDLDAIWVETTGIAEPLPISWTFAKEALARRVRLAAIITVVDAKHHFDHRELAPAVDNQVEYADILALSKQGMVTKTELDRLLVELRRRNPRAAIIDESQDTVGARLWQLLADPIVEKPRTPRAHAHPHAHNPFHVVAFPIDGTLDLERLTECLEQLPADFVRIKGIARVIDRESGDATPRMVAFHRVGARVSAEPVSGNPTAKIVAIGVKLDEEALRACLRDSVIT